MTIRVGVVGYDLIGKRVAAAVALQADMTLEGVCEEDPSRRPAIAAKGYPLYDKPPDELAASCDILADFRGIALNGPVPVVCGPQVLRGDGTVFSLLAEREQVFRAKIVKLPSADAVALARLVRALAGLGRIERLFSAIVTRSGHATSPTAGCVDALEPIFDCPEEHLELAKILSPSVDVVQMRRVRAPYTHSHLHMLKLDLDRPVERNSVLQSLASGRRILLAPADSGFTNTAQLQEFFRDVGRNRGDRPEAFIWEEAVLVFQRQVCLIMDVDPEAALTAECIDAIRLNQVEDIELSQSVAQTDRALGIGRTAGGILR
jgi:glyceraldehyde-3-phosphate dehydrogenase (NAD(P))